MSRTWDENRNTINDFWGIEFRPEEGEFWRKELSPLNQDVLYLAICEVKRSKDSPWPQLAWIHAAYRRIGAAKLAEMVKETPPADYRRPTADTPRLYIDTEESARIADELRDRILKAETAAELADIRKELESCVDRLEARTLFAVAVALGDREAAIGAAA